MFELRDVRNDAHKSARAPQVGKRLRLLKGDDARLRPKCAEDVQGPSALRIRAPQSRRSGLSWLPAIAMTGVSTSTTSS